MLNTWETRYLSGKKKTYRTSLKDSNFGHHMNSTKNWLPSPYVLRLRANNFIGACANLWRWELESIASNLDTNASLGIKSETYRHFHCGISIIEPYEVNLRCNNERHLPRLSLGTWGLIGILRLSMPRNLLTRSNPHIRLLWDILHKLRKILEMISFDSPSANVPV